MILADTSIWVDHFRSVTPTLAQQLAGDNLIMHPYVLAELSLGLLRQRARTIALLDSLPSARVARMEEVRQLIEFKALQGRGIGFVDVHLLASAYIQAHCRLWTRDRRLKTVAEELGVHADLS